MEPKDIAPMEPKDFWTMYLELQKQADALSNELTELQIRSADVSKQLEHVEMTMRHLAPLTGVMSGPNDDIKELGITDAVRSVLDPKVRLSATEVRAKMQEQGYDLSKYSAPDATVRTILKRLVEAKKAEDEKEGHKVYYKWLVTDEEIPF
jgi:hypothetical protein